jgi:uncharacterized membrane protein
MNPIAYYLPIALIIVANVFYNICTKSTPESANPFLSLMMTYLVAAIFTCFLFIVTGGLERPVLSSLKELNWTSYVLGFSVVFLELGYILAYRLGWNISIGSLVANIGLAIILIPIGILCYQEVLSINHIFGIMLCVLGLIVINH